MTAGQGKELAKKAPLKVGAGGTPGMASASNRGALNTQSRQQSSWSLAGSEVLPASSAGATLAKPLLVQISAWKPPAAGRTALGPTPPRVCRATASRPRANSQRA